MNAEQFLESIKVVSALRTGFARAVPFSFLAFPLVALSVPDDVENVSNARMSIEEMIKRVPLTKDQILYQILYPYFQGNQELAAIPATVRAATEGMFADIENFIAAQTQWSQEKDCDNVMLQELRRVANATEVSAGIKPDVKPAARADMTAEGITLRNVYLHYRSWIQSLLLTNRLVNNWFNSELLWPMAQSAVSVKSKWYNEALNPVTVPGITLNITLPSQAAFADDMVATQFKFNEVFLRFLKTPLSHRQRVEVAKAQNLENPFNPSLSDIWIRTMTQFVVNDTYVLEGYQQVADTKWENLQDMLLPKNHFLRVQNNNYMAFITNLLRHRYFPSIMTMEQFAIRPWHYPENAKSIMEKLKQFILNKAYGDSTEGSIPAFNLPLYTDFNAPESWFAFYAAMELREILLENMLKTVWGKDLEKYTTPTKLYKNAWSLPWRFEELKKDISTTLNRKFAAALIAKGNDGTAVFNFAQRLSRVEETPQTRLTPQDTDNRNLLRTMYTWTMCPYYKHTQYSAEPPFPNAEQLRSILFPMYNGRGLLTLYLNKAVILTARKHAADSVAAGTGHKPKKD